MNQQAQTRGPGRVGLGFATIGLALTLALGGCGSDSPTTQDESIETVIDRVSGAMEAQREMVRPVEAEQIENVIKAYFVRYTELPEYRVTVEEVEGNWARATIITVESEATEEMTVYLQDQSESLVEAPTAEVDTSPGNTARTTSATGWTIVAGPQAWFSDEELDAANVPAGIRS